MDKDKMEKLDQLIEDMAKATLDLEGINTYTNNMERFNKSIFLDTENIQVDDKVIRGYIDKSIIYPEGLIEGPKMDFEQPIQEIGIKHDKDKFPFCLVLKGVYHGFNATMKVLEHGWRKYGANNWQKVDPFSRYEDALLRHLDKWLSGEWADEETGLPHLAHIACNCWFLIYKHVTDKVGQ